MATKNLKVCDLQPIIIFMSSKVCTGLVRVSYSKESNVIEGGELEFDVRNELLIMNNNKLSTGI